jgi:starch-binding outer membrane protein, SusD/RagB family
MRIRHLLLPAVLLVTAAGCDNPLDVNPVDVVAEEIAITDAVSARAALAAAYDALQDFDYYGTDYVTLLEVLSDNALHTGTFTTYADADLNEVRTDHTGLEAMWDALYFAIDRANVIIERIPNVPDLDAETRDQMLGEAHFLRALSHHNLARVWGGVPVRTARVRSIDEASSATRATLGEVYAQIHDDLDQAEALMSVESAGRTASDLAVRALRTRVLAYEASPAPVGLGNSAGWAAVEAQATAVINTPGLSLAANYADLFSTQGSATSEDIFRVAFSDQDQGSVSYYYVVKSLGGRRELAPTSDIRGAYEAGDARADWSVKTDPINDERYYAAKFPSVSSTEHIHVIRLAEIYLIRAEARARQGNLAGAVDDYNVLRARAGLQPHVLGVDVVALEQNVLDAIWQERRVELAFEGDRWPELIRTGRVDAVMTLHNGSDFPDHQQLFPIPQAEIDVTGGQLAQNPGY